MLLFVALASASARDCAHRLSGAPVAMSGIPAWTGTPLPYGASLRADVVVLCPSPDGEGVILPGTVAVNVDLAYAPVWVYHVGSYPSLREQIGLHLEPWALTESPARSLYFGLRLGIAQWFVRPTWHRVIPSAVVGFRVEEPDGPATLQLGVGAMVRDEEGLFPLLELRLGVRVGGRDEPGAGTATAPAPSR